MAKNIYIVGFMGTGKSTVGRELAKATGRRFIDMDKELEEKFSMSINEIFDTHGESFFREEEKKLAFELIEKRNHVISTGGGTIMDKDVLNAFRSSGIMICLIAGKSELITRLSRSSKRPLLRDDAIETKVEALMHERNIIFNSIPIKVNTTDITPMEVVRKLIKLFKIRENVLINLGNEKEIEI